MTITTRDTAREIHELIQERRSVRKFNDKPVSPELVKQLLQESARSIAFAYDEFPCRCVIACTEEGKRKMTKLMMNLYADQGVYKWMPNQLVEKMFSRVEKIPLFVIVIAKKGGTEGQRRLNMGIASCFVQNFALICWQHQIGQLWCSIHDHRMLLEDLQLDDDENVHCLLYVGSFDKPPKKN